MPITPHIEKHFLASALVRDIVIGMADGLTVPFALAAGLSGAVDQHIKNFILNTYGAPSLRPFHDLSIDPKGRRSIAPRRPQRS